jgi:hypothetical protein
MHKRGIVRAFVRGEYFDWTDKKLNAPVGGERTIPGLGPASPDRGLTRQDNEAIVDGGNRRGRAGRSLRPIIRLNDLKIEVDWRTRHNEFQQSGVTRSPLVQAQVHRSEIQCETTHQCIHANQSVEITARSCWLLLTQADLFQFDNFARNRRSVYQCACA